MSRVVAKENTLSEILGVSTRRIREVCKDAKVSTGNYELKTAIKLYIENLKGSGRDEIAELRKVEKELKEYKLSILKRESLSAKDVEIAVADMQLRTRSKAMSIPSKASLEILGKTDRKEIELILKKYVYEFLKEMAMVDLEVEHGEDKGS